MDELRKLSFFTAEQSAGGAFTKKSSSRGKPPRPEDLPRPSLPSLISIQNGKYSTTTVGEPDLLHLGTKDKEVAESVSGPTLEMAIVSRKEDDSIELSRDTLESLGRNFGIDPITLQHIYMCSYGFYHYDDCRDPAAPSSGRGTRSFFFGCFLFSMVWSFDLDTRKTSAILVLRTIARHYYGSLPLMALEIGLKAYRDRLNSPLSLAFVILAVLTHVLDDNLYRIVKDLRKIEAQTNHGPSSDSPLQHIGHSSYGLAVPTEEESRREQMERQETGLRKLQENEDNIDALTEVARKLADVNVHLANLVRHAKLLRVMADTLENKSFREAYCRRDSNGEPAGCTVDTDFFLAIIPSLHRRLVAIEPSIEYLEDRAKGQHQVVFGLLTHEDAEVNLGVARANTRIASAARDDSSAMKTIALMTMIFLPGTFYAALFALPSLNFDKDSRPGVIQDGFGLYWAFTAPSTLLVMLASWVMHRGWAVLGTRGERARLRWEKATGGLGGKPVDGGKAEKTISAAGSEV